MSATRKIPTDHTCQNCRKELLAKHYADKYTLGLLGDIASRTNGDVRLHDHGVKPVTVIWHWQPGMIEYPRFEYGHTAREALERVVEFLDDYETEMKGKPK